MICKVGINGFGTIGKRVADAVQAQKDMVLTGVTKTKPDYGAVMAINKNYPLFSATQDHYEKLNNSDLEVQGDINNLIDISDVIIDCSPSGFGIKNKKKYKNKDVKAIYQGGEPSDIADTSFNSTANFEESLGKDSTRVVSCNTTALCRTLYPIHSQFNLKKVRATMIRRGADPNQDSRGPIDSIIPKMEVPSHHGPDLQTIIPDIDIDTTAVKVPTTIMHMHLINFELNKETSPDQIINLLEDSPRVALIDDKLGINSTSQIIEIARDLYRPRNDIWETPVWRESIKKSGDEFYLFQAVHQESDVVPENIDAIRALMEMEKSGEKSIKITDGSMGLLDKLYEL